MRAFTWACDISLFRALCALCTSWWGLLAYLFFRVLWMCSRSISGFLAFWLYYGLGTHWICAQESASPVSFCSPGLDLTIVISTLLRWPSTIRFSQEHAPLETLLLWMLFLWLLRSQWDPCLSYIFLGRLVSWCKNGLILYTFLAPVLVIPAPSC